MPREAPNATSGGLWPLEYAARRRASLARMARRTRASIEATPPLLPKAGPVEVRYVEPRPPAPRRKRSIAAAEDKDTLVVDTAPPTTPVRRQRAAKKTAAPAKKTTARKKTAAPAKKAAPPVLRIPRKEYRCPICHHYCDNRRRIVEESALVAAQ